LDYTNEIGIDFSRDTYDAGLHLNLFGAEKLSRYFGKLLAERYALEDRRSDLALKEQWSEKVAFYEQTMVRQYAELESLGYLKAFNLRKDEE